MTSCCRDQASHEEEHYTDLHMLRVTKELQTFIKGGDVSQKQKEELEKVRECGPRGPLACLVHGSVPSVTSALQ